MILLETLLQGTEEIFGSYQEYDAMLIRLNNYIGLMLAAYLASSAMATISGFCNAKLSQKIVKKMREELLAKIDKD